MLERVIFFVGWEGGGVFLFALCAHLAEEV